MSIIIFYTQFNLRYPISINPIDLAMFFFFSIIIFLNFNFVWIDYLSFFGFWIIINFIPKNFNLIKFKYFITKVIIIII